MLIQIQNHFFSWTDTILIFLNQQFHFIYEIKNLMDIHDKNVLQNCWKNYFHLFAVTAIVIHLSWCE
jgi:hypothetical protein